MKLPSISYVYRKTAAMISTMADKAYCPFGVNNFLFFWVKALYCPKMSL